MNFVKYLENSFQEMTLKNQVDSKENFDVVTDASIKSIHMILEYYRTFIKWGLILPILLDYVAVNLDLIAPPKPVLMDKMKHEKAEREACAQPITTPPG